MNKRSTLLQKIETLDRQIVNLAIKICEVDMDFDHSSTNNKKYRKLVEKRRELLEQRQEYLRTFNAEFIDKSYLFK